jgi:hypothetical protein
MRELPFGTGRVVQTGIKVIKIINNEPGKQSEDQYGSDPSEDVGPPYPPVINQQPGHVSPHCAADRHHLQGVLQLRPPSLDQCSSIGSMMSSIFLPGRSLSWAPYIDGCFSSGSEQCSFMLRVPSLAVPLSKTKDRRPVSRVVRSMLKAPALSLYALDLKISSPLVFSCQHQSPRNSSGIEPRIVWAWAGCHCAAMSAAAAINFFIAFFLILGSSDLSVAFASPRTTL